MIAGIDEAGRGALAGPVVSALVILNDPNINLECLKDSKTLSENKRNKAYTLLKQSKCIIVFNILNNKIIDNTNILEATLKSMTHCINKLHVKPNEIIIDGNITPNIKNQNITYCVKGDSKVLEISAASIIAKVIRDKIMKKYGNYFPEFEFDKHKGYGTKGHYDEISKFGTTPIHRKTFNLNKQLALF